MTIMYNATTALFPAVCVAYEWFVLRCTFAQLMETKNDRERVSYSTQKNTSRREKNDSTTQI